jgi:spermidine/putrescine-binding protein
MAKPMEFARRLSGANVPAVQSTKYKTGEAIVKGSLLLFDANGELTLFGGGAGVVVCGLALEAAGSRAGYNMANSPTVFTGRKQEISYVIPGEDTLFWIDMFTSSAGTTAVTAAQTHINEQYGAAVDANGNWFLDTSEVTALVFEIIDIDTDLNRALVKIIAADVQQAITG